MKEVQVVDVVMNEVDRLLIAMWGVCGLSNVHVKALLKFADLSEERRKVLFDEFRKQYAGRHGM